MNPREILEIQPRREAVKLPGGREVLVRGLTAGEQDEVEFGRVQARESKKPFHVRAFVASRAVIRDDGSQVFKADDMDALNQTPDEILAPIVRKALELSGTQESGEDPVEAARGN